MDQVYTSDELSGRKLVVMASAVESKSLDIPDLIAVDYDTASSCNQLKKRQFGSERTPLIRPRRSTDLTEDTASQENSDSGFPQARYGSIPLRRTPPIERARNSGFINKITDILSQPKNSVMTLLLIIIIGVVLVFAANIKTDTKGAQVKPEHVSVYLMVLIFIFIMWTCVAVIPQKLHYSTRHDGALFPSHLLTGIGIFGTVSAASQILIFLDYLKCSYHVDNLSSICGIYPMFKIAFIYFQIYFFYKLSRDGIRHASLPGGTFFVMVTLATNLCIWVSVFFHDASSDPKLKNVSWLNQYHYGVESLDFCANASLTSPASRDLHALVGNLSPYICTFSMEYALLASGLLLHIWMVIKSPTSKVPKPKKQPWTLWRVGFILGLLSVPVVFVAYMKERSSMTLSTPKVTLYVLKVIFFLALMVLCWRCIILVNESSGFVRRKKPVKLEVVLLGISAFLGFPAFDLSSSFAAICEWQNFPTLEVVWYFTKSLSELFSCCIQFLFIKKAYQYKIPMVAGDKVKKSARFIRQYASFAFILNLAYWASNTYELRETSGAPTIAEEFFGRYAWFALSHFSLPLCIFFYFHIAICYANVVSSFSRFEPLWLRSK